MVARRRLIVTFTYIACLVVLKKNNNSIASEIQYQTQLGIS